MVLGKRSSAGSVSKNVLGSDLVPCGFDPLTGFYRDGCCDTGEEDVGRHTVCVEVSQQFLEYSRFRGNDLTTPCTEQGFVGLQSGNRWCLCAARWLQAYNDNMAPRVILTATHEKTLDIVPLEYLKMYALDLN